MTPLEQTRFNLAQTVIKGLERRNMTGEYCATLADAKEAVGRFLIPGTSVACGGSMTLGELGFVEAAKAAGCNFLDRFAAATPEEQKEIFKEILFCDTYFMSTNAITQDGVLVNIDGNCNRISALSFGPEKVVVVAGMNKVAPDLDSAVKRARNSAAPANCVRLGLNTPCAQLGKCADCSSPDCICCQFLITRRSRTKGRIHIILIGEELGY